MGRKNFNAFLKNQKAEKKKKKKLEKQKKKETREHTSGLLDNMIAYVDEDGNIVDELPRESADKQKEDRSNLEE
ncbi:MAG: cold-shock protein [Cytophagales bacterium]|nr:cold-shock protein [Cytophagales bacterium]